MQGDSTSNEEIFGKVTIQERHTQHKDSGVFFFCYCLRSFNFVHAN